LNADRPRGGQARFGYSAAALLAGALAPGVGGAEAVGVQRPVQERPEDRLPARAQQDDAIALPVGVLVPAVTSYLAIR
jgi:hypothetical protein